MKFAHQIKTYLFPAWENKAQQNAVILTLWRVIGILIFANLLLFIGWIEAPNKLRVYVPPNLEQGGWLKPEVIPPSTIYAFAYQIFTSLNTWSNGGEHDYKTNIYAYKNYFSERYFRDLLTDYSDRSSNGGLNRNRVMAGVTGRDYDSSKVRALGNGTWEVNLTLHIVETVDATVVKDVIMTYPIIISKVNESIQVNPWGLQITGFSQEPVRDKTII
jgi:integrating conjugative element protein (TIGR03746 family)